MGQPVVILHRRARHFIDSSRRPGLGRILETRRYFKVPSQPWATRMLVRCYVPWQRVQPRGRPRAGGGGPAPGHVERAGRGDPRAAQWGVPAVGCASAAVGGAAAAAAGAAAAALAADQRPGEHHARLVVVVPAHDAGHLLVRDRVVGPCAKEQVSRSQELFSSRAFMQKMME